MTDRGGDDERQSGAGHESGSIGEAEAVRRDEDAEAGRDPQQIQLTCCRPIEVTKQAVPQDERRLRGTPEQLVEAIRAYRAIGVEHLALQFIAPRWPDRVEQIEQFAQEVMPYVR